MEIKIVEEYLKSTVTTPFFLFVGDELYSYLKEKLQIFLELVPISRFCKSDKPPNFDELEDYIKMPGKKSLVTGIGEYLALQGSDMALNRLGKLKNYNVGDSKTVLLLRGVVSLLSKLEEDQRFKEFYSFKTDNTDCNLSFTFIAPSMGTSEIIGLKELLKILENGACGDIVACTAMDFNSSIFNVQKIDNSYKWISFHVKSFAIPQSCGNDKEWTKLKEDLDKSDGSLEEVFDKYKFDILNIDRDFHSIVTGESYRGWLYFIFLKIIDENVSNSYIRYVLGITDCHEDFIRNFFNGIINISPSDERFKKFYTERKLLAKNFKGYEISDFIANNRRNPEESIYRLTDNTIEERKEIIVWIGQNEIIPEIISEIYPRLWEYLKKYFFKLPDEELGKLLTEYFDMYKQQKVINKLCPEFLNRVDELALERKFMPLPSRNEILETLQEDDTNLYWLDALGVEYLALTESLAKQKGLSISISLARSELPTITAKNNDFYYNVWRKNKYLKDSGLDDIKHDKDSGYEFTKNKLPIHLAAELDVIENMMDCAASELKHRNCKRFLIVSDHGASRLAVLSQKEEQYGLKPEQYETDTKAEYSGRYCEKFEPYDLPFAAISDDGNYLVLADYGRFKGSRRANVEVHGGASLEEVIIPIIELSLKDGEITVELTKEVFVDSRKGAVMELFFNTPVEEVSLILEEKWYLSTQITKSQHHLINLSDIIKIGTYQAGVYAGNDFIDSITFEAQRKSFRVDSAFEDSL